MPLAKTIGRTAFIVAVVLGARLFAAGSIVGEAEVVDGDGLKIGPVAIRIHGIDAPELGQRCTLPGGGTWACDEAAADRLDSLVHGREVECEPLDRDAYGRIIARCVADGEDVAAVLIEEGLAWAFVRYSTDYAEQETNVRATGRGIWQAATQPPWEYREDRWNRAVSAAPGGCPIKGNINDAGERIYHTPWSPWYGKTKINEAAGERWFCDEAEAIKAGWRAARFR
jgi:endonuclease YncB( thermonuclease family)